jgi:hypothetical protein
MIKVFIELWPYGNADRAKNIGELEIANDGSGFSDLGDYKARLSPNEPWTEKAVVGFPRQTEEVTKLLYLALKKFYAE